MIPVDLMYVPFEDLIDFSPSNLCQFLGLFKAISADGLLSIFLSI